MPDPRCGADWVVCVQGQNVTTVIPIQKDRSGALKSYTIVYIGGCW